MDGHLHSHKAAEMFITAVGTAPKRLIGST